jgi:hypothetical protein
MRENSIMSATSISCANCARPMSLTRVSTDAQNPGQQVFTCGHCRLIEIRPPHDMFNARVAIPTPGAVGSSR